MPNMANLTVKASNGSTDVVYTAMAPSSGDGTLAHWRNEGVGDVVAHRPKLTLSFRDNAAKTARVYQGKLVYPDIFEDSNSGEKRVVGLIECRFDGTLPNSCTFATKKEAIYQLGNVLVSSLVRACLEAEYGPQ